MGTVWNSWGQISRTTSRGLPNTRAAVKKTQQHLHFLRVLRKNHLNVKLLVAFYHSMTDSILTYCITVWHVLAAQRQTKRLFKES